jgi:hypothetical protein
MGDEVGYAPRISKKVLARLSGLPLRRHVGWRQRGRSAALRHLEFGEQNFFKDRPCNYSGNKRERSNNQAYPAIKAQHIFQCHGPASRLLRWIKA